MARSRCAGRAAIGGRASVLGGWSIGRANWQICSGWRAGPGCELLCAWQAGGCGALWRSTCPHPRPVERAFRMQPSAISVQPWQRNTTSCAQQQQPARQTVFRHVTMRCGGDSKASIAFSRAGAVPLRRFDRHIRKRIRRGACNPSAACTLLAPHVTLLVSPPIVRRPPTASALIPLGSRREHARCCS